MLEALLLMAVTTHAVPSAEVHKPAAPSLELLEFLGEFGDDDEGVFEPEPGQPVADKTAPARRTPAKAKSPPESPPANPPKGQP